MKVIITTKPGSDFQKKSMEESLQVLLTSFELFYRQKHKNNEIKIEYVDDDIHDQKS